MMNSLSETRLFLDRMLLVECNAVIEIKPTDVLGGWSNRASHSFNIKIVGGDLKCLKFI